MNIFKTSYNVTTLQRVTVIGNTTRNKYISYFDSQNVLSFCRIEQLTSDSRTTIILCTVLLFFHYHGVNNEHDDDGNNNYSCNNNHDKVYDSGARATITILRHKRSV